MSNPPKYPSISHSTSSFDSNAYDTAISWGLGTDNSRWGPGLENTVDAEAIRNPIHAFLLVQCSMCIPKNTSHNFPSRLMRFRTFWCTSTRFNLLFWSFTWFRSILVVDPCFIHRHKSTQKLFQIAVKIDQILLRCGYTNAFLVDCENRGIHLRQSFLMHKCVCKILTTRSVKMDTISRNFNFGSFKTISWILLIISGVMISFG